MGFLSVCPSLTFVVLCLNEATWHQSQQFFYYVVRTSFHIANLIRVPKEANILNGRVIQRRGRKICFFFDRYRRLPQKWCKNTPIILVIPITNTITDGQSQMPIKRVNLMTLINDFEMRAQRSSYLDDLMHVLAHCLTKRQLNSTC